MRSPLLMYAICTASARHLTRVVSREDPSQPFEFNGIPLPNLEEDSAIHYHNTCISYLVNLSNDPEQAYTEDTLTAATALRYYEQIDSKSFVYKFTVRFKALADLQIECVHGGLNNVTL